MNTVPDVTNDPAATLTLLETLHKSGLVGPIVIITLYELLVIASKFVPWLKTGRRAAVVAALLGGGGTLAAIAATGVMPNAQQLIGALGTAYALLRSPLIATTTPTSRPAQSGRAHVALLAAIATVGALVLASQSGCGGASVNTRTTAATQAFATCAKADLTSVVGSGSSAQEIETVIGKVVGIVTAGLGNWMAELDALAAQVGPAAWTCILDFVEAFLSPPVVATTAGTGPGSGKVGAEAPSPALLRLRAYRAHALAAGWRHELDDIDYAAKLALDAVGAGSAVAAP